MQRPVLFTLLAVFLQLAVSAQSSVYTADIDRFWIAYDSARTTADTTRQQQYIRQLYIDPGTEGLKAFMKVRNYDARRWVMLINKYPRFWTSIRPNTLQIKNKVPAIEAAIGRLKALYPEMKPARMFFTVGALRSGGTTSKDMVLIGAEIATGDKNTDASELGGWLNGVFKAQDLSNIVALNIHEYIHTQEHQNSGKTLLSEVLNEGAADFMAELATGIPNNNAYMIYGRQYAVELREKFKTEMFGASAANWLYNGNKVPHADLGYYIGYCIGSILPEDLR